VGRLNFVISGNIETKLIADPLYDDFSVFPEKKSERQSVYLALSGGLFFIFLHFFTLPDPLEKQKVIFSTIDVIFGQARIPKDKSAGNCLEVQNILPFFQISKVFLLPTVAVAPTNELPIINSQRRSNKKDKRKGSHSLWSGSPNAGQRLLLPLSSGRRVGYSIFCLLPMLQTDAMQRQYQE